MDYNTILNEIKAESGMIPASISAPYEDEVYLAADKDDFNRLCLALHKKLNSPVMMFFAVDETKEKHLFRLYCVFEGIMCDKWLVVTTGIPEATPEYNSLSKQIYSATLFEREMKEMFGLIPLGNPDTRSLHLHEEVWPEGNYPLRKNFDKNNIKPEAKKHYVFKKTEGVGIFEVPVGPVHAGIIGPGHFRFSVAGEPIINLEPRLGFTHRGIEKLFENKYPAECLSLAERVSGDSSFSHSLAFCQAVEKINSIQVSLGMQYERCIFLELERMYNHASDIGGIALDVGFSFPAAYASIIKESILCLNETLTGSRYIKGVNIIGGVSQQLSGNNCTLLLETIPAILNDFRDLKDTLLSNASFMDRADGTGILKKKIAEDIGIVGVAAKASGIPRDLRKNFPVPYNGINFTPHQYTKGDVLARMQVRIEEFEESVKIIKQCVELLKTNEVIEIPDKAAKAGFALGYSEGWRGPVLYWIKLNESGLIDRCKIVDPSFHNWQGLSYAVLGNIIPDFPLCNKSFGLSYSGNDL
jgi:Ni,Fe-hydrogenase III large subunit/Ni,Fe-hydrogenase III component G